MSEATTIGTTSPPPSLGATIGWRRYRRNPIIRRTARLVVTLFLVTFLTTCMLDLLPGDPALAIAGGETFGAGITDERLDEIREELGFNDPLIVRYFDWLGNALQGDFGTSYRTHEPVGELISSRLPVTLELMLLAQLFALTFALVFAPLAALYQGRSLDRGVNGVSFALVSIPTFVSGLLLIQIFAVWLGILPSTGFTPIDEGIVENLKSLVMPAVALAAAEAGIYTRVLRSGLITSLDEDYSMMASAKGLSTTTVIARHALRPASLPLLTLIGLSTGAFIGGAVITESIFALPGVGRLMIDSINTRDLVTVQAMVALIAVFYVVINYLVDLAYLIADPRIRYARS